MTPAYTAAENVLLARGFTEVEIAELLCPIIGETYREVAEEAFASPGKDWGATPTKAVQGFGASFAEEADRVDPEHAKPGPWDDM
jgi:hypothetical protein